MTKKKKRILFIAIPTALVLITVGVLLWLWLGQTGEEYKPFDVRRDQNTNTITYCAVKGEVDQAAAANLELAKYEFKLPPLLTDEDVEDILSKIDDLVTWASDIKEYALQQAISGKEWSGWKLVEGRSNRKYTNDAAVAEAVTKAGFDPYERKLLGVIAMQKLLGKSRFDELLTAYIEKPQGKPTLVPDSDKRPAMNTAKNDFMEENDNE